METKGCIQDITVSLCLPASSVLERPQWMRQLHSSYHLPDSCTVAASANWWHPESNNSTMW